MAHIFKHVNKQEMQVITQDTNQSFASMDVPEGRSKSGPLPAGTDNPLNGSYASDDEDEDEVEEDLILGDEDAAGGEEEFDVELDEDIPIEDIDEDDLVIDPDEDDEDDDV